MNQLYFFYKTRGSYAHLLLTRWHHSLFFFRCELKFHSRSSPGTAHCQSIPICSVLSTEPCISNRNRNRNRNLKTSKALLKSQAHQGTSLFTSAATNQRG